MISLGPVRRLVVASLCLLVLFSLSVAHPHGEALAKADDPWLSTRDERIAWWTDARFGMFIHWGLYAIPAGEWNGKRVPGIGEWIMHRAPIKPRDYQPLAQRFNPTKFDADAWVRLMKDAGCRYFVITTKHHDGFALFRSDVSDYDIAATPFGEGNNRDIMRELADAARRHGVRIGWYHSVMDWRHPDYLPRRKWDDRPTEGADFDRYRVYLHAQVEEILNNYGPIDIIWFDGEWEASWTHEHGIALHEHCMEQNPKLLVNNRVDKGRKGMQGMNRSGQFRGDFGTPEQEIPETGFGEKVYWESCMTMNNTWGYKKHDKNWKSTRTLIRNLVDTSSKGGNYLLNVGPTAAGEIPTASQERLRAMGKWLAKHGESIYGTSAGPVAGGKWGRTTMRGRDDGNTDIYVHVFDWPADSRLLVPGLTNKVLAASGLGEGEASRRVAAESTPEGLVLTLGTEPWDAHASVMKVTIAGAP